METKIKEKSKTQKEISFSLKWEEFFPYYQKAVKELSQNAEVPGFRKGNVPENVLKNHLGEEKIITKAAEKAIKNSYLNFLKENKIEPIGPPKAEIKKMAPLNDFVFSIEIDVLSEVDLPDYKKIAKETEKPSEAKVKEEEVEHTLKWIQQSRAQFSTSNEKAKKGDFVEIGYYSPKIEGGRKFHDSFFLGQGHFVPDFEKNLEGMKSGGEKDFEVEFPKNYQRKDWAGKKINFHCEIKKVENAKMPEINDELAKNAGNFKDLEALKESIREGIKKEKKNHNEAHLVKDIIDKLTKETKIEIPQIMVEEEKKRLAKEAKAKEGKTREETDKKFQESDFEEKAKNRIREYLIIREIGKRENIKVEEKEAEERVNKFLKQFSEPEKIKDIDPERIREYYKGVIFNEKVAEIIKKYANNSNNN